MLVSPAEPPELRALGVVASITERYGADFIIMSPVFKRVGIQRKEVGDLINSLHDGRIGRELWQQKQLDQAIWLIEGTPRWTTSGQYLSSGTKRKYTRSMHLGVILSLSSNGSWVLNSSSLQDSIVLLSSLNRWLMKEKHSLLLRRPNTRSQVAGDLTDKQIHVMQGFDKVGYDKARDIVEASGGLPFQMRDGVDLRQVKGVGRIVDEEIRRVVG